MSILRVEVTDAEVPLYERHERCRDLSYTYGHAPGHLQNCVECSECMTHSTPTIRHNACQNSLCVECFTGKLQQQDEEGVIGHCPLCIRRLLYFTVDRGSDLDVELADIYMSETPISTPLSRESKLWIWYAARRFAMTLRCPSPYARADSGFEPGEVVDRDPRNYLLKLQNPKLAEEYRRILEHASLRCNQPNIPTLNEFRLIHGWSRLLQKMEDTDQISLALLRERIIERAPIFEGSFLQGKAPNRAVAHAIAHEYFAALMNYSGSLTRITKRPKDSITLFYKYMYCLRIKWPSMRVLGYNILPYVNLEEDRTREELDEFIHELPNFGNAEVLQLVDGRTDTDCSSDNDTDVDIGVYSDDDDLSEITERASEKAETEEDEESDNETEIGDVGSEYRIEEEEEEEEEDDDTSFAWSEEKEMLDLS